MKFEFLKVFDIFRSRGANEALKALMNVLRILN